MAKPELIARAFKGFIRDEYDFTTFQRLTSTELTDTVDQDKITADLKQGVLTLVLPKTEVAKPGQIPVQVS
jgi:HSP20 family protein